MDFVSLKEGDVLECISCSHAYKNPCVIGKKYTVARDYPCVIQNDWIDLRTSDNMCLDSWFARDFKLITSSKKTIMSTIKDRLRDAFLKGSDKIMVEAGLENPAGVPTSEGEEVMKDFLYRKFREELAKEVSALPEEEK